MNAEETTLVMLMHTVTTHKVHINAHVTMATKEMEGIAQVYRFIRWLDHQTHIEIMLSLFRPRGLCH